MNTENQILTLEDFTHWKVPALRDNLSCRGLSSAGDKQEMVALAYSAHVMKIPSKKTASDNYILNNKCYSDMLKFGDLILPDPFQLYENWQDEKHGTRNWPPLFITDLTMFLMRYETEEVAKNHLNQYKIGKAYQYFQSEWLKKVFYHLIYRTTPYCFIRAECNPSESLRSEPHKVWVCLAKDSGEIKSAFCKCTAGYTG